MTPDTKCYDTLVGFRADRLLGLIILPITFIGIGIFVIVEFADSIIGWLLAFLLTPLFVVLFIWCVTRLHRGKETALSKPIVPPGFERSQGGERAFLIFGSLAFVVLGIFMLTSEVGLFGSESLNQLVAILAIGFFSLTLLLGLFGIKAKGAQPVGVLKEAATIGRYKTTDRKSMSAFWWVIILAIPFAIWVGIREANSPANSGNSRNQSNMRLDRVREETEKLENLRSQRGQKEADRIARDIVQGMADNVYYTYLRDYQLPVKRLQITSLQASGISGGDLGGTMDIRFSWKMQLSDGERRQIAMARNMGLRNAAAIDEVLAMANGTNHQVRVHFRQDSFGDFTYETELLY